MQKTNFPIEVLIHDDASTDGTADIIREYEQKYPEIIKPIYQTENQFSKGMPISRRYIFPRVQGKYLAICEGDDYWTDEYKLQKQVDFLEANEDFSICFHPVKVYKEEDGIFIEDNITSEVPEVTDIKMLAKGNFIHTLSVMYRVDKKVFEDLNGFPVLSVGDYLLHMLFAKYGKIKKLPDTMGVYRVHNSSTWSSKPIDYTHTIWLKLLETLLIYFANDKEVSKVLKEQYINIASHLFDFYFVNKDFFSIKSLYGQVGNQFKNQYDETLYLFSDKVIDSFLDKIDNLHEEIYSIKNSISYRLGRILLTPLRMMRRIIHKEPNNSKINTGNKITTLKSFAKAVKMLGGTVFCNEIMTEWDINYSNGKILLVSHELSLTGAPIALYYFVKNLQERGKHPVVISPFDGSLRALLIEENIPVFIFNKLYVSDLIHQSASQFELIFVNTILGAPVISALNGANTTILWWIHESNASYSPGVLMAMPEQLKDNIHVYCGGSYAAAMLTRYRPNYRCEQLLYFIPDYAQSLPEKTSLKIKFAEGKCIFALVGTQIKRKGYDILIQAIRGLPLEKIKSCLFIFVGRACYVPIKRELAKICKEYPQNIQFIKELGRKDLQMLYNRMDCLVCSSRDDPMPLTVTEAMLMSQIIICSENTGSAELLKSMDAGLIYRNNSPQELAALIEYVLENRHNLSQMREQARKTYERYFSQEAFNASVKGVLQKLNDKKKSLLQYNGTVSVIIPTYNGGEELHSLIEILNNQAGIGKVEVIIVDSGSKDGSAELAAGLGAAVLRITQAEFSHSYARNLGTKNAAGEYLLFMTQDALPTGNNWLNRLMQPALQDNVVAVSCRQIPKQGCDLLGRLSLWIHYRYLGILQSDRTLSLPKQTDYDSLRINGQLDDVACLIRKDIFMQFLYRGDYAEDLDLGIRLIQAGYKISLLSSVQVIHSHTRPAVYHLKRCIVETFALKKILPDFPIQEIDAQSAINRITTAYCAAIYLIRYLIETCEMRESFSGFCKRIKRRFSHILSIIKKMKFDKIKNLIEEDTKYFDGEIRVFIQKLLACYNTVTYDPSLASDQIYFIIHIIHRYLENTEEVFTPNFKLEICGLLVKRFGQIAGSLLASYLVWHPNEENSLTNLISEYSSGV
jgi:glycosyltransferase involved in cell wall biosynthesis